jgi:hypothetical protein
MLLCPTAVGAQVAVGLRIGAVGSSNLVRDSVVEALDVRPQVAPQLGLRVSIPVGKRYTFGGDLAVSRSDLRANGDTASTTVTALTQWAPGVFLRAALLPWLGAEARIGALIYDPKQTVGTLFADGAPIEPLLGLGVTMERALGSRLVAAVFVQYDAHRFTTTSLRARGFTGETTVHRVALGLSLSRAFGRASP